MSSINASLTNALRELAGVQPAVIVEPEGIEAWSVEKNLLGMVTVSPSELERVTVVYANGHHNLTVVIYDRERDIVHAFEMSEFRKGLED